MIKIELWYFSPANNPVMTDSGFCYLDTTPVVKGTKEISGNNEIEIFEKFYELNNSLRYCNGSYYRFISNDFENKYNHWIKSDDFARKHFNLYYGNGIVD